MQHGLEDQVDRLAGDRTATLRTVRDTNVGEEQTEIVVDLGDGPDGGARVGAGGLLLDRDGRRQALDQIDIRLLDLLEELPRVGRQRLDVAPLPFRINGVEGERRLARPGETGDDDQTVTRQADIDTLQVVDAGAAHLDVIVSHGHGQGGSAGDRRDGLRVRWAASDHPSKRTMLSCVHGRAG